MRKTERGESKSKARALVKQSVWVSNNLCGYVRLTHHASTSTDKPMLLPRAVHPSAFLHWRARGVLCTLTSRAHNWKTMIKFMFNHMQNYFNPWRSMYVLVCINIKRCRTVQVHNVFIHYSRKKMRKWALIFWYETLMWGFSSSSSFMSTLCFGEW